MARAASFHFHGYQPGDFLRRLPGDPFGPMALEERHSPVAHRIGGERIEGRNWTDAVLRSYGRMEAVLEGVAGPEAAASVDVEPHTLVMLLERDPAAYDRIARAYARGSAALVLTPPFHPILPHHQAADRELLFDIMFDFYAPWLRPLPGRPVGLWLPEAAVSADTLESFGRALRRAHTEHEAVGDVGPWYLLLDGRQIERPRPATSHVLSLPGEVGMRAIARSPELSNEFAFGATDAVHFAERVRGFPGERALVASDLESLLANPMQAERFEAIVGELRRGGRVSAPEPTGELVTGAIRDFSSWSDYEEDAVGGLTGDTRWTGLRAADGLVVHRLHRGRRMSQFWKHAFTQVLLRVEAAIRREARRLLRGTSGDPPDRLLNRLVRSYARELFRPHFRASGIQAASFAEVAHGAASAADPEMLAYLARSYIEMFMGLRSDPRFWENPDTRVTFQSTAFLAHALEDMAEAANRAGRPEAATRLHTLLRANLLEFADLYYRGGFSALHGVDGWETTEAAWHESLQSEVPTRSGVDVVQRATVYAVRDPDRGIGGEDRPCADTGHIAGEAHGEWRNTAWCEHRTA